MVRSWLMLVAFCLIGIAGPGIAQTSFAGKPLHWVVPFAPGGPADAVARVVAQQLSEQLAQPVLIENRAGASGNLGSEQVARGAADGTVMLMVTPGLISNPLFYRNSLDPRELRALIQLTRVSFVLLASQGFAAHNIDELVATIKAKPGTVTCAASGALPTVACVMLASYAQAEVVRVQYKGNAPALNALMGGEINILFDVVNTALPQVRSGRVRALASSFPKRGSQPFPDLPVLAESMPGFEMISWQGLMVPRATPTDTVQRLNRAIASVLNAPLVRQRIQDAGLEVAPGSAEAFQEIVDHDQQRYTRVLQAAGITPE